MSGSTLSAICRFAKHAVNDLPDFTDKVNLERLVRDVRFVGFFLGPIPKVDQVIIFYDTRFSDLPVVITCSYSNRLQSTFY